MKKRMWLLCLAMLILLFACGCEKECEHEWADADCVNPKICDLCGEERGSALGHTWVDATCTTPKTCSVCKKTEGEALNHKWNDATCDKAKTCSLCAVTEGDPLEHIWAEANCTAPKTCTLCAKTEGDPLGHKWREATCAAAKTCSACAATEGDPLPHTWVNADCTNPKTCSVCAATEGEPAGHTEGEWELASLNGETLMARYVTRCKTCGTEMNSKEELSTTIHNGENYLVTPAQYNARLSNALKSINLAGYTSSIVSYQGLCTCAVYKDYVAKGLVLFEHGNTAIYSSQENDGVFTDVLLAITGGDDEAMAVILVAVVMACDPSLDVEGAKAVVTSLINLQSISKNGIAYACNANEGNLLLSACVE